MKTILLLITSLLMAQIATAELVSDYQLPENGKIKTALLTGSFSCKDLGVLKPLDLNGLLAQQGNWYPELYINYSCGSTPMFQGSGLSLIAQIGELPLEEVDENKALTPLYVVGESHNFRTAAPIIEGMTYSIVLNTPTYRGLLVFKVISYKESILTIKYATRKYALIAETQKSNPIDYEKKNSN